MGGSRLAAFNAEIPFTEASDTSLTVTAKDIVTAALRCDAPLAVPAELPAALFPASIVRTAAFSAISDGTKTCDVPALTVIFFDPAYDPAGPYPETVTSASSCPVLVTVRVPPALSGIATTEWEAGAWEGMNAKSPCSGVPVLLTAAAEIPVSDSA